MNKVEEIIKKVRRIDQLEALASNCTQFEVDVDGHWQKLPADINEIMRKAMKEEADKLRKQLEADISEKTIYSPHSIIPLDCCVECGHYNEPDYCTACRVHTGKGHCHFTEQD